MIIDPVIKTKLKTMMDGLCTLGTADSFLSQRDVVRAIGMYINNISKAVLEDDIALMQTVFYYVKDNLPEEKIRQGQMKELEWCWDGIGNWRV